MCESWEGDVGYVSELGGRVRILLEARAVDQIDDGSWISIHDFHAKA